MRAFLISRDNANVNTAIKDRQEETGLRNTETRHSVNTEQWERCSLHPLSLVTQVCGPSSVVCLLRRQKQVESKFKVNLNNLVRSCLKIKITEDLVSNWHNASLACKKPWVQSWHYIDWAWWCLSIIQHLEVVWQEDWQYSEFEFEARLVMGSHLKMRECIKT